MLQQPDEHCPHEATVLALLVRFIVGGTHQEQLAVLAIHLVVFASLAKEVFVGVLFPVAKPWAGAGARSATFFTVATIGEAKFFFKMKRLVLALFVFVADHIVWARNYATGASGA